MNNKTRQKLRAIGLVVGVYSILALLAIGITSVSREMLGNIVLGLGTIVCTAMAYGAALEFVKWQERDKDDKVL